MAARLAYLTEQGRPPGAARRAADDEPDDVPIDYGTYDDNDGAKPKPRLAFTRRHLLVVGALCAVGIVVMVWFLGRSSPQVTQVALAGTPTPALSATPAPTPAPPTSIRVHVWGSVKHPGVVTVKDGDRVADAIAAAGGLLPDADPAQLNLAQPLVDGSQIAIGRRGRPLGEVRPPGSAAVQPASDGASQAASGPASLVNLNTADEAALDALPGVGPVTAQKILAWRKEHQRFTSVDELQEVSGIGPKVFERLKPLVRV